MQNHIRNSLKSSRREGYFQRATQPLNCLIFLLPLLLFFHLGTAVFGPSSLLAMQDLHRLLGFFGATAAYLPAICVIVVLLIMHAMQRLPWQWQLKSAGGIAAESIFWMLPLIALGMVAGRLLAAETQSSNYLMHRYLVAVGAGIYEEFIFRLLFVGLTMAVLVKICQLKKEVIAVAAILVSGVCFSLYHFDGSQLTTAALFPWREFIFRSLAGIYLGGLFLIRGFGVVVGAHAAFDIYAVMIQTN